MTSHSELVKIAREWLRGTRKCTVVVAEISTAGCESPDAIGWYGTSTHLVECKSSRSDFLADRKKLPRVHPSVGMGDYRWYLTSTGVIKDASELPEGWGWVELCNGKPKTVVTAKVQPAKQARYEQCVLLSVIKRIGQNEPEGVSIRAHTYQSKNRTSVDIEIDGEEMKEKR